MNVLKIRVEAEDLDIQVMHEDTDVLTKHFGEWYAGHFMHYDIVVRGEEFFTEPWFENNSKSEFYLSLYKPLDLIKGLCTDDKEPFDGGITAIIKKVN